MEAVHTACAVSQVAASFKEDFKLLFNVLNFCKLNPKNIGERCCFKMKCVHFLKQSMHLRDKGLCQGHPIQAASSIICFAETGCYNRN
jgi:hypothetical protein